MQPGRDDRQSREKQLADQALAVVPGVRERIGALLPPAGAATEAAEASETAEAVEVEAQVPQ
jgi:hypothetical protein